MKGRTQADHLHKMMHKHQAYSFYTLALPWIEVKKNVLEKLEVGDVLLLGLDHLPLFLIDEEGICATAKIDDQQGNIKILDVKKEGKEVCLSNKYQMLTLTLGTLQTNRLEEGDILRTSDMMFDKLRIQKDEKTIAVGSLVKVDGAFAVHVDKVER